MFKRLVGLLTVAVTGLFLSGVASADITSSAHDLGTVLSIPETQICIVCHSPHENQNAEGNLLWNHDPTVQTFTPYTSPTLDGGPSVGPGPTSTLCLGCHDGTIAVDSYGGATGTNFMGAGIFSATAAFGPDLSNDHPVGITYDDVADTELNPTTTPVTFGVGSGTVADMLQAGMIECASCHDVHNSISEGNTTLLNVDNTGSGLCLACHNK